MSNILILIIVSIISALVGGFATYLASYFLEKRKWEANAAILRKDSIYSPIYNELASLINSLDSFSNWKRSPYRQRLSEWEKIKEGSSALIIPHDLKNELNLFIDLLERYHEARSSLLNRLKGVFPERNCPDCYDYVIADTIVDKMLISKKESYEIVFEYLRNQRPSSEPQTYLSHDLLTSFSNKIETLEEWNNVNELHSQYIAALKTLHAKIGTRIQKITERFQRIQPNL